MTTEDTFHFAGAMYRPILDDISTLTPQVFAEGVGQWVHIPYGGNVFETDDTTMQTTWQVRIWVPPADDGSDNNWSIFKTKLHKFATLETPWGNRNARLAKLDDARYHAPSQSWRASATWEWS